MRIANRYDTVITRARISRTTKEKALKARYGGTSGVSASRSSSYAPRNTVTQMLLQQLGGGSSAASTAEKLAGYQSRIYDYGLVNVAAERVGKQLEKFMKAGEDSLFAKAEESGDYSDVEKELSSFVGDYNLMLRKLKESGDSVDAAYAKQLKAEMNKHYSALRALGITSDADGILTFDQKTFEAADKETLKELFGGSDGLSGSLKKVAGEIWSFALKQQKEFQEKMYTSSSNYSKSGMSDYYEWLTGGSFNAKG